jgi:DNA-binding beta-propeller fold protein YncE
MKTKTLFLTVTLVGALGLCQRSTAAATSQAAEPVGVLAVKWHPAGFADGDDSYNGLTVASDGKIYYALSSHKIDSGAQMYSYDPASGQVKHLADLTEVAGGKGRKAIPQGKVHVNFYEHAGKLYFATHLGYYRVEAGREMVGVPPEGYLPYPGGHFLSYELATGKFEDLATAPGGEGIITMTMDEKRGILYGLTWPTAHLLMYDLAKKQSKDLGPTAGMGEKGTGPTYRVVCRAMVVDPYGGVVFTTSAGDVLRYGGKLPGLEKLSASTMKRDIFGQWNPDKTGTMGYNWRQMVWDAKESVFYGTHGGTGYLFSFDPRSEQMQVIDRIASDKTRRSGAQDSFSYGYLGLTMGPDGHTLYYLTGTPLGEEVRFVTFDTRSRKYTDHGALAFEDGSRPTWAQSIAVGPDKRVYTVSKIQERGKQRTDLLSFADPLQAPPAAPEPRYRLVRKWSNPEGGKNPLKEAHNSCLDKNGNIIISDSVGSRIQRFTPEGKWLDEIGSGPGSGQGQFAGPREARVGGNGDIFVADSNNHRIQVFNSEGKWLRTFGSKGSGPGQMLRVHGLAFSPDFRRLYVADVDNNRVDVFEPSGKFLFAFGKRGERTGQFRDPHGIGVDAQGNVYVSNYYGPVEKFTADGKFLFEFAEGGSRGWIHYHYGTADRQGNVYLAGRTAADKNAVVMYDRRGAYVTAWGIPGEDGGELSLKSIDVAPDGRIYTTIESKDKHGMAVFEKD